MKKKLVSFVLISFAIAYLGYGFIIYKGISYREISGNPLAIYSLLFATLIPAVYAILILKKEDFSTQKVTNTDIVSMIILIVVHLVFVTVIGNTWPNASFTELLISIATCMLLFGLQEIGWNAIVFRYFLREKGLFKSAAIVGLLKSLTYFPLFMMEDFILDINYFAYIAVLLIGISTFSTFLYSYTGNVFSSCIFVGVTYGFMVLVNLNMDFKLIMITFLECIIIYGIQDIIKEKTCNCS